MQEPLKSFLGHIKGAGLRMTREREDLFNLIMGMKEHFTTEELLKKIKNKKIRVSRATVYRLLPLLVKAEIIQQSLLSESHARFEVSWNRDHHDHLICSKCDKVIEFQHSTIEVLQREIASRYGFVLDHHVMELVGRCKNCRKN